jgi:predicted homoserine dehydrogenase-like protein
MRSPARSLARQARAAGVVYSLAWGDQPALVCEHVDWARACGFSVVAAGKGTRYHPSYHRSTPDTLWNNQPEDVQLIHRRHQVGHRDECRNRAGWRFHHPRVFSWRK